MGGGGAVVSQAQFLITGEGQKAITVNVPATFTMGTLTVTTINTTVPYVIGGAFGTQGTATVNVGGSFTVSASTPRGNYSGSFTVTADYN